jgi:hypothetical protein
VTGTRTDERATAIAAADGSCPRCGSARAADDRYCLECGLALPRVGGGLARMRRAWIRRLGWYPGDWIWAAVATLVVAIAGAAAAVVVSTHRSTSPRSPFLVPATVPVGEASPAAVATSSASSTLPVPPEPTSPAATAPEPAAANGHVTWPANEDGWTVVLVSYPKTTGRAAASTAAERAARGLRQVGVLDSSSFASLQPGYFVVFSGIYPTQKAAETAVPTARQAGFRGAYTREVAR